LQKRREERNEGGRERGKEGGRKERWVTAKARGEGHLNPDNLLTGLLPVYLQLLDSYHSLQRF
jgi:hypothetical protein